MKLLDLTFDSPAENLAADEALLDAAEDGHGGEVLRFWEPRQAFVVLGYANRLATEVNEPACRARGIPILRRPSGGGTVVQGPGCLNYAVVLWITPDGPLHNIAVANQYIMRRNRAAIESARGKLSPAVAIRGHTDLAIGDRKFSGNAQRRRKHYLLFHGTFLLNFDLGLIGDVLPLPSKQPAYRENRGHDRFLMNLKIPAERVKAALRLVWQAEATLNDPPREAIKALARGKYLAPEWNNKF